MKKFAVYYQSKQLGDSYIHIFAKDASEAVQSVKDFGIGFYGGKVFADRIIGVQQIQLG